MRPGESPGSVVLEGGHEIRTSVACLEFDGAFAVASVVRGMGQEAISDLHRQLRPHVTSAEVAARRGQALEFARYTEGLPPYAYVSDESIKEEIAADSADATVEMSINGHGHAQLVMSSVRRVAELSTWKAMVGRVRHGISRSAARTMLARYEDRADMSAD